MSMSDYVLMTDSASDIPKEIANELGIEILPMKYIIGNDFYSEENISFDEFYSLLRNKDSISTTQINCEEFLEYFSKHLSEGKDILYIGFSLSLSGMYNSALMARDTLIERYPKRKIKILNSVCASIGQGLLVYHAALRKNMGMSIEEVEKWTEENKLKFCHWFTVDDLYYLKRGGRISSATAVLGSILNIKPLLSMNDEGNLYLADKIRGRQKVLNAMISKIKDNLHSENKLIIVGHVDCFEEAQSVASRIEEEFSVSTRLVSMGPIIGAHTGPGTIGLTFMGNSR